MKIPSLMCFFGVALVSVHAEPEGTSVLNGNQSVTVHGSNYAPITLTINSKKNPRENLTLKSLLLEVELFTYYQHLKTDSAPPEVVGVVQMEIRDRKGQSLFEPRVTETDKASIRWHAHAVGRFVKTDPVGDDRRIARTRGSPLLDTTYSIVRSDYFVRQDGAPMTVRDLVPIQSIWLSVARDTDFKVSPARASRPTLPKEFEVSNRTRIRMFGERADGGWLPILDTNYGDFLKPYVSDIGTLP